MSRGQARLRSQTTMRILNRCQNKSNTEDAIIIDDDSENAEVVLIDNPNTSNVGSMDASTSKLNCLPRCVIYIDDEEEEPSNLFRDTTSNRFSGTFNSSSSFEDPDDDDCVMFVGNGNVHCDHSGPSRNHFGLDIDSESSTTESTNHKYDTYECDEFQGSSDCEIMEDHSGNIREQWEKAASRKEGGPFTTYQANASSTAVYPEYPQHEPVLQDADVENCSENVPSDLFKEIPAEFIPRTPNDDERSPSVTIHSADENIDFRQSTTVNISPSQSCQNSHIPYEEPGNWWKGDESTTVDCSQTAQSKDDGLSLNEDAQVPVKDSFFAYQNYVGAWFPDKREPSTKSSFDSPTLDREQVSVDKFIFQQPVEQKYDYSYNTQSKSEIVSEQVTDYKEKNKDYSEGSLFRSWQYEEKLVHEDSIDSYKIDDNVNKVEQIEPSTVRPTSLYESDTPNCYENLIGDRERHKKTDQYKRVTEAEWASRKQQLQIQAEEAQRLRRRRKAEKIRLLDMEKRQKQRLQEIRDLQKKDEENTQLKEHIRAEVRRVLERVEMNCTDMASVLRIFGIHVKGGVIPMAHEINAAYKQALLRFHPDRAPRTDIRQQVEAEEKFKLISRLKEKLLF